MVEKLAVLTCGNHDALDAGLTRSVANKPRTCLRTERQAAFIKQCKNVATKLRKRVTATIEATLGREKDPWASLIAAKIADTPPPHRFPPWTEDGEDYVEQLINHEILQHRFLVSAPAFAVCDPLC